jgi:hypothetical protein
MRRDNAMLKLGTRVEYENQTGRIVGRTIEGQPKYDVMLASGAVCPNVREGDLVILQHAEAACRSVGLETSDQPAKSPAKSMDHEQTAEEARNADLDRRR